MGKFLAIATYCFLLIGVLAVYVGMAYFSVESLDLKFLLSGLFGLFLLICTYASIGLFMSCLTSYQVIAAICTLVVLGFLNMVGGLGKTSISFVTSPISFPFRDVPIK